MLARTISLALTVALLAFPSFAQDKGKDDKGKDDKGKDDKGKVTKAEPFDYPLAVGTTWTYRVAENRYTLKVAKKETVGKQECAVLEMRIGDKLVSTECLAIGKIPAGSDQEGSSALMRFKFEKHEATPPIPILLLSDKSRWVVNSKLDGKEMKGAFEKKEEGVKVPAGEYSKAVKVTGSGLTVNGVDLTISYWFVSGVGMVKQEATMAGQSVVIELERLVLGK
jgi:hypothetical protein